MRGQILAALNELKIYDVHTHLSADHMAARGLHDVLLYHMVIAELYSAGCPSGERVPEDASEDEIVVRIEEAIPYLRFIRNTSIYALMTGILADLYDWHDELTLENWREADRRIREKYNGNDPEWAEEIFRRAGVKRACTELSRRGSGCYDNKLKYALEWGFFARGQWGHYDAPLLELERAWLQEEPCEPLPVTIGDMVFERKIVKNVADVKAAVAHYCEKIPTDQIISTAQHISTDIDFCDATDEMMEAALKNRENAGEKERNIYASYVFNRFLDEFEKKCGNVMFQFSFGAEPLPFEMGSKLRSETVFQVADIISKHPGINFQVMLATAHQNQAMCSLARELPNLSVIGYWWQNFFPAFIARIMEERLDMLPVNRQIGFFSDAYCADWMYAKSTLVKSLLADVLEKKMESGQYTFQQALSIAEDILCFAPEQLLHME